MRISDWSSDVCSSDLVDTLLNAAEPTIEQTDVASINGVLAGADRTLAGRGPQVRDVFPDLADLASTFADREVELARLTESTNGLAGVAGRSDGQPQTGRWAGRGRGCSYG